MNNTWRTIFRWKARILMILVVLLWSYIAYILFASYLTSTGYMMAAVALLFLITLAIAWKWETMGATMLFVEGIVPFIAMFSIRTGIPVVAYILGIPSLVAGILFLLGRVQPIRIEHNAQPAVLSTLKKRIFAKKKKVGKARKKAGRKKK